MTTTEEQLRKQLAEALAKLEATKKKKRAADSEWTPPFDGAHRGY